jgi:hypothetical protein
MPRKKPKTFGSGRSTEGSRGWTGCRSGNYRYGNQHRKSRVDRDDQ